MFTRRNLLKVGTGVAIGAGVSTIAAPAARAHDPDTDLKPNTGISPWSGAQYKAVPSVCAICPSRCPVLGYLEDGRLAKIEGNVQSIRTEGKLCSRGQAAVEQVYDPDRILYPLKRVGKRGEGKWQRISWEAALAELSTSLKALRESGKPERLVVLHGWLSVGTERLLKDLFLPLYGSGSVVGPASLGQSARRVAHQLTWGAAQDHWDIGQTRFVLNFGSNFLEASNNFVALARRFSRNAVDNRARMVTFDVRLSNTAARSDDWLPIKPGTDLAVVLAMCNVVMTNGLYQGEGERFLEFCRVTPNANASVEDKVKVLKEHLAQYTPEWAEKISGVPAARIKAVATAFATTRPGVIISHRGASAHYNGVDTERAIQMLAALTGNIDNPGSRCQAVLPSWVTPKAPAGTPPAKRLAALDSGAGAALLPLDGVMHQALRAMKADEGPAVLLWVGHNPVYANGEMHETAALLADESRFSLTVAVTPFYDESAALADLILPEATFLESYDIEEAMSATQVAEYAIRQPVIEPLGEAKDFKDILCDLGGALGLKLPVKTGQKFVEEACRLTPEIRTKARGFTGMRRTALWTDKDAKPIYRSYMTSVAADALKKEGVILDEATGVYWNWKIAGAASEEAARATGYTRTPGAAGAYVAQRIGANGVEQVGDNVFLGFPPGKFNKSGLFELYSDVLNGVGGSPLPAYTAIPEHKDLKEDQLILTTYKVNVQSNSRTQNSRYLNEIHYENPAWMNPATARARGIANGDQIKIASPLGEIVTRVRVTHSVAPYVIAVSTHCGHTEYGRFASGKRSPTGVNDSKLKNQKWWTRGGVNANAIIPKSGEPISGQQRWMDTVVTVKKA